MKANYDRITERAFTAQVIALAQWHGWRVAHFRPAQDRKGRWKTPVQGDGVGFPDLVLVNPKQGRVIFAELKTEAGKLTEAQHQWLDALAQCDAIPFCGSGLQACVWRPSMIDEIEEILK